MDVETLHSGVLGLSSALRGEGRIYSLGVLCGLYCGIIIHDRLLRFEIVPLQRAHSEETHVGLLQRCARGCSSLRSLLRSSIPRHHRVVRSLNTRHRNCSWTSLGFLLWRHVLDHSHSTGYPFIARSPCESCFSPIFIFPLVDANSRESNQQISVVVFWIWAHSQTLAMTIAMLAQMQEICNPFWYFHWIAFSSYAYRDPRVCLSFPLLCFLLPLHSHLYFPDNFDVRLHSFPLTPLHSKTETTLVLRQRFPYLSWLSGS